MTTKSLAGFTALMLAAFAVLIGLGVWQLQRLHWKQGLIAEIETRSKGEPIALDQAIAIAREGRDPSYYRVKVEGRFDHAKELYLYAVSEGRAGWHVITPLATESGEVVLIDRGFVPDELRNPAARAADELGGMVTVIGIVRVPETQGSFTPDNEIGANRWFWRDLQPMARAIGTGDVAPFYLEAEKGDVPGGWPEGGQTRLELPNNHLQYAITWFLLAAALLVIYGLYLRSAYRSRDSIHHE
jgi:surfeit locus 1 family protein